MQFKSVFIKLFLASLFALFLSSCQGPQYRPTAIPPFPVLKSTQGNYQIPAEVNLISSFDMPSLLLKLKKGALDFSFQNRGQNSVQIKSSDTAPYLLLEHYFDQGSNLVLLDVKRNRQVTLLKAGLSRRHPQFGGYTTINNIILEFDAKAPQWPKVILTQTSLPSKNTLERPGPPQKRTYSYDAKLKMYLIN